MSKPCAPTVRLNNGVEMPLLGLGTWKSEQGKTGDAVKAAIRAGYRLIDTANDYNNEHEIGKALKELLDAGEVKREDLFIQSKLWNANHRPAHVEADLRATLADLQLDYVDSFIIHWPQACPAQNKLAVRKNGAHHAPAAEGPMFPLQDDGTYSSDNACHFVETWHAMEDLVAKGLARTIGLSNFNARQISEVVHAAKSVQPAVLQNECHPYLQQKDLLDVCRAHKIVFQAFSPLGSADRPWLKKGSLHAGPPPIEGGHEVLQHPTVKKIAEATGRSPAQVVLRWHAQRGIATVPKSVTPERIAQNIRVFDFDLSAEQMAAFDALNVGWRHCIWAETSMHPDYPFKDDLPHDYVPQPAPGSTTTSGA
eukprot:TRINITY_DN3916_c0_g1_i1.p1 TRINITY_DN3916_c0_g1~~TRINITY_DN3916_c0_g1_i1.p1  ORF type:complete len:367 (-),score=51.52 TRINITY_DN3916_c0_g1_i1:295-1395(-)